MPSWIGNLPSCWHCGRTGHRTTRFHKGELFRCFGCGTLGRVTEAGEMEPPDWWEDPPAYLGQIDPKLWQQAVNEVELLLDRADAEP